MNYQTSKCVIEKECIGDFCFHHVKSRGSGGDDSKHNLMPLCAKHHTEIHMIGLKNFSEKYSSAKNWLCSNGWKLLDKWRYWND